MQGSGDTAPGTVSNSTSFRSVAWTDTDPTTGDADLLVDGVDAAGIRRLYRADLPNTVYASTEALDAAIGAGDWGTAFRVGETDANIVRLYSGFDTVLVGKENGFFFFLDPYFRSATDLLIQAKDKENFSEGIEFADGKLYLATARLGLMGLSFESGEPRWEQVEPRYQASQFDDYGGRVRALAQDGLWLYALQDTPIATTTVTKGVNLVAASYGEAEGAGLERRLWWHTLRKVTMGIIGQMAVHDNFLWMGGQLYDSSATVYQSAMYRMALPTKHGNMMLDETVNVESTGTKVLVTAVFDFDEDDEGFKGYGQDDKAFSFVQIFAEGVTADRTITVAEQRDTSIYDGGTWTAVGAAITSLTNGAAIVSFTAPTIGKRIRLRFTLATEVATAGPILRGFRLWAAPHPDRYWFWEFTGRIATGQSRLTRALGSDTAQNIFSLLNDTLDAEDWPIKLNDVDGTQYDAQIVSMEKLVIPGSQGTRPGMSSEHLQTLVRMQVRQVRTS